jgi:hypothetical protein
MRWIRLLILSLLATVLAATVPACGSLTLPQGWPATLPLYPGAVLTKSVHRAIRGEIPQYKGAIAKKSKDRRADRERLDLLAVDFRTSDQPEDIGRFYDAKAKAAGFLPDTRWMFIVEWGSWVAMYSNQEQTFSVSARIDAHAKQPATEARLSLTSPLK